MPLKAPPRKRYTHKKTPKHFARVYWPYLPLAVILLACLFMASYFTPVLQQRGTLAYATNMSMNGLLEATNHKRLANGSKPLALNEKLNQAAQAKANDMAQRNYWSHVAPDGKQPWYFFDQSGYKYQKAGENLAYGFLNSDAAVVGWMNSPSHKDNLLDSQFVDVGFGIANMPDYQGSGPQTIVVALYGKPLGASVAQTPQKAEPSPFKGEEPVDSPIAAAGLELEPPEKSITVVQTMTGGKAPWSTFAVGLLMGGMMVYMILKHGFALRRAFVNSERFILHHPLLDAAIVSLIAVSMILSQTAGVIR